MERKVYIAPQMEIADIELVTMIATSAPKIDIVDPNDPNGSGSEILSNRRRGTWGNLWTKDEE